MTIFADGLAASGWSMLAAQHGQSATYTPVGGDGVSLTAILGDEEINEDDGPYGIEQMRRRSVFINTDPAAASGGVAEPKLNDTITIGTEVWQIESASIESGLAELRVIIYASAQRSTQGYRS